MLWCKNIYFRICVEVAGLAGGLIWGNNAFIALRYWGYHGSNPGKLVPIQSYR